MDDENDFDVAVVGGGPAGLTTALYTTRLGHDTVVVNRGGGRAAMMRDTHNVIGVTEDVSGNELLQAAIDQIQDYGAEYRRGSVTNVEATDGPRRFRVETGDDEIAVDRVVLATGFSDATPDPPLPRTGRGLHYCLHCDAYMFVDESVYVMGHGESAAHVAMIMLNFTDEVDLLLRGHEPEWSDETDRQLRAHPVEIVDSEIESKFSDEDDPEWLGGFEFEDGTRREYKGGFAMYGSQYNNGLAADLGCDLTDDGTVAVDDHGRTSIEGVFAVGDLTPGHNQIPVAMGQGAKAGIAIHYDLRRFPMSPEEIEAAGGVDDEDVPAVSADLRSSSASHAASDD
ncbi:NAD(P)/FAD-dependent oxidoreductase [Halococcus saccharolyticus]|uniref:Thioredoxin reductase n=1 Tax=Halococcus saccharolyticus DSM 5350 TaxID=1227455 RepID=M0MDL8_9EURY|nr:NAD(P)/FAD-dependent oxidoreductase [Halococcus saccharolyticus]EMA43836.1 thioredoxin reductase [Halococcus saccharolyticus DSM 5350]